MSHVMRFWRNEAGAVTVDWVVLTAAIVSLGIAVVAALGAGVGGLGGGIASALGTASIDLKDFSLVTGEGGEDDEG